MCSVKRLAAVLIALTVLAGGCSDDKDEPDAGAPTTESTGGPTTETSAPAQPGCNGIGPAPKEGTSEITWIDTGGKLWAVSADGAKRCLIEGAAADDGITWGGAADRVMLRNKVVFADGRTEEPFPLGGLTVLSRPSGKSVLQVRDGKLNKRELGKDPTEITFLSGHGDTVYHPAGQHIVSTGSAEGRSTLMIANNLGQGPQDLVQNETANLIYNPTFTASGALLFFADHGEYTELHRLEIDAGNLTTIEKVDMPDGMADLVTSPFEGGGVAWAQGACDTAKGGRTLRAQQGGQYFKTAGTAVERGQPVGWTPDGALVVAKPGLCDAEGETDPGDVERTLYRFKDGTATEIAKGVQAAAVRAVLPPPPAPPKKIPQQAPA